MAPSQLTRDGRSLSAAVLSDCGPCRYQLRREWDETLSAAAFLMLKPSTADGEQDDPTIRRCIGFAQSWGCGSLLVANLYGLRATNPAALWTAADPVGPDNDTWLRATVTAARDSGGPVIAAWALTPDPAASPQCSNCPEWRRCPRSPPPPAGTRSTYQATSTRSRGTHPAEPPYRGRAVGGNSSTSPRRH